MKRIALLLFGLITWIHAYGALGAEGFVSVRSWSITGEGVAKADGEHASISISRDAKTLPDTYAVSAPIAIKPGVWQFLGKTKHKLYSPDMSFNVELKVTWLDKDKKSLGSARVITWKGKQGIKPFSANKSSHKMAAFAQLELRVNKTNGNFTLDDLKIRLMGELQPQRGGDRVVRFSTAAKGFLFYPQQDKRIAISIETPIKLTADHLKQNTLTWQLKDFWGMPQFAPETIRLYGDGKSKNGNYRYRGELNMNEVALKLGNYYELHTKVSLGQPLPAEDKITFAVLPSAPAKNFAADEIPFGSHTWDARLKEYFEISGRLGLRRCLIFWQVKQGEETGDHDMKPGSFAENFRLNWPKKFGLRPYAMWYPIYELERGNRSLDGLADGIKRAIEIGKPEGLWGFQIGNEPPHWNEAMIDKDVEAYKIAYNTIKSVSPETFVIGSAIGPEEAFFKRGFHQYCDAVNIHSYADVSVLREGLKRYKELFKKYGHEKPVYSTEIGSKSQGLSRFHIAKDIIKKAVSFFADGGEFFTWFAISYPDPTGKRRGSYGDSMDLFAGYLNMFNARIDAVAYYHLINTMLDKRFVSETMYMGDIQSFVFSNKTGETLQVLYRDKNDTKPVFISLPGVGDVQVTAVDGRAWHLNANQSGVHLEVGDDPLLVRYLSQSKNSEGVVEPPHIRLVSVDGIMAPGETVKFTVGFESTAVKGKHLHLRGPHGWGIVKQSVKKGYVVFDVTVPSTCRGQEVSLVLMHQEKFALAQGAMRFRLPVEKPVGVKFLPAYVHAGKKAGIKLILSNNSSVPRQVTWGLDLKEEIKMARGDYDFSVPLPPQARFLEANNGEVTIPPESKHEIDLALKDWDHLSIYRIEGWCKLPDGDLLSSKRLVGGFGKVVKCQGELNNNGFPKASDWRRAMALPISEERQYYRDGTMARGSWDGPEDLQGTIRFLWDQKALYLRAEVVDDIFANPGKDHTLWRMDGLQMLINPWRQERQAKGRIDLALGLGQQGPQAWRHLAAHANAPTGNAPDVKVQVERNDKRTEYLVAMPWRSLAPFKPVVGGNVGLSLILNEDDAQGRCGFMGWFSGVHLKEIDLIGDLILCP